MPSKVSGVVLILFTQDLYVKSCREQERAPVHERESCVGAYISTLEFLTEPIHFILCKLSALGP